MHRAHGSPALLLLALACACGPKTVEGDGESSSTDASTSAGASSSESESSSDDAPPSDASSDESTTAADDDYCVAYCEVVDACTEFGAVGCLDDCHEFQRYRADNFDEACQAATAGYRTCVGTLTCEAYDEYGCEPEGIAEYEACLAGPRPQPGAVALCMISAECAAVPYDACIEAVLDYNVWESYDLGCEQEYDALMACIGGLTCAQYEDEAMVETLCAAETAAVDAACPTFGQD